MPEDGECEPRIRTSGILCESVRAVFAQPCDVAGVAHKIGGSTRPSQRIAATRAASDIAAEPNEIEKAGERQKCCNLKGTTQYGMAGHQMLPGDAGGEGENEGDQRQAKLPQSSWVPEVVHARDYRRNRSLAEHCWQWATWPCVPEANREPRFTKNLGHPFMRPEWSARADPITTYPCGTARPAGRPYSRGSARPCGSSRGAPRPAWRPPSCSPLPSRRRWPRLP